MQKKEQNGKDTFLYIFFQVKKKEKKINSFKVMDVMIVICGRFFVYFIFFLLPSHSPHCRFSLGYI